MSDDSDDRMSTGVAGLDEVLGGGLISKQSDMLHGQPGAGKSLLAPVYLVDGIEQDEECLFVALEETETDIRRNAAAIGLDIDGIAGLDLTPGSSAVTDDDPERPKEISATWLTTSSVSATSRWTASCGRSSASSRNEPATPNAPPRVRSHAPRKQDRHTAHRSAGDPPRDARTAGRMKPYP